MQQAKTLETVEKARIYWFMRLWWNWQTRYFEVVFEHFFVSFRFSSSHVQKCP
jgi:hypothetical protein